MDHAQAQEFARTVVDKLRAAGHQALWAGGCVRDSLLGQLPKDFDVATSARPQQVRDVFGRRRTLMIGEAFGVVVVLGPRGAGQVEVATFRKDAGYSDGRHPDSVEFSTAEEDAKRRDFTINGMFFDPISEEVVDYVGGRGDLAAGIIRAIGNADERISEDKLRMLRAVRFATQLDFQLEATTLEAIRRRAGEIELVSAERIGAELRKILSHRNRAQGVELLRESNLLKAVSPRLVPVGNPEAWRQSLVALEALKDAKFEVSLAALIVCLSPPLDDGLAVIGALNRAWRLTNREVDLMTWLIKNHAIVRDATESTWPAVQRLLVHDEIPSLLHLGRAVAIATDESQAGLEFCCRQLELPKAQLDPPPLLTGDDLKSYGIPPGRIYARILKYVRDQQLMGKVTPDDVWESVDQFVSRQGQDDSPSTS